MTIITKPVGGILKGLPATFTLNKSQVLALSIVSNDDYFSDSSNWKKIILKYESSEGKQQELVRFDATLASPTGFFFVSEQARDLFEIKSLKIVDFDGDVLVVPRSALVAAEFDIDFGVVTNPIDYITWDLLSGYQAGSLVISPSSGVSGGSSLSGMDVAVKSDIDKATGDFDYTFKFDWSASTSVVHMFAGVTGNNITTGTSFYQNLTCIYGNGDNPDTAHFWHNGSVVGNTQTLINGENIYRVKRVGSTITQYLNSVQVHSATSTIFTAYPSVRTVGNSVVTESYITEAPAVQAVTWNVAGKTGVGTVTTGANGLITRSDAGGAYNLNVLSNETIAGDGYVEFVIPPTPPFTSVVFGLAEVNSPTGSFNNLLIGCYLVTNPGALEGVITTGNLTVNYGNFLNIGTAQTGSVIKIARVGTTYSIQINNGAVYSTTINNTNPLKVSISPYFTNSGVENVTISD